MSKFFLSFSIFAFLVAITGLWIPLGFFFLVASFVYFTFESFVGKFPIPEKSLVVITGCSSGIGRDLALQLAKSGVTVFAGIRKKEDGEELKSLSENIYPINLDVTKTNQILNARQQVQKKLDEGYSFVGLVNNAGYAETGYLELLSIQKARKQFDVNVFGHLEMTQEFLPLLRKYGPKGFKPRVIFVGSTAGDVTQPGCAIYSASKRALDSVVDGFRQELKTWGIKVILIKPGAVKTDTFTSYQTEKPKTMEEIHGRNLSSIDPAVVQTYTNNYTNFHNLLGLVSQTGESTKTVTTVLNTALFGRYPNPRYFIGSSAYLTHLAFSYAPELVIDTANSFLTSQVSTFKRISGFIFKKKSSPSK